MLQRKSVKAHSIRQNMPSVWLIVKRKKKIKKKKDEIPRPKYHRSKEDKHFQESESKYFSSTVHKVSVVTASYSVKAEITQKPCTR